MTESSIQELRNQNESLGMQLAELRSLQAHLLSRLAHDVRNPLASVQYALEMMRPIDAEVGQKQRAIEIMDRQIGDLRRSLDDGVDVMRIVLGQITLQKRPIELAAIVAGAVGLNRPRIQERKHDLSISLPADPLHLDADPGRITQAVSNLLHNAARFTNVGGRIRLSADATETEVVLRVEDNGPGIEPARLPRLFDPALRDRTRVGVGVGLMIVRKLVELHGGTVQAFSNGPGHGSEFVVRLPSGTEAEQDATLENVLQQASQRILIVANDQEFTEEWSMLLRIAGHDIRSARDEREAIDAAVVFRPDVVLIDSETDRPPYDAVRAIRTQPELGAVLMVVVGADAGEESRRQAQEAGAEIVLANPVRATDLLKLIAQRVPINRSPKP